MTIADTAHELSLKIKKEKQNIETEEATKNAFVMPFISRALGYDVFEPEEVMPEFTADVGTKKGEKVDYAIFQDSQVQMLIEVKSVHEALKLEHASQLYRYFSVTNARIAVLTNGQQYEFYTDLDVRNRMDSKPFLVLDLLAIDETILPEVGKLAKESFDLDSIINAAEELKYIGQLKRILAKEFKEPSSDWVRFLAAQVYEGKFTQRVRDQFVPLVGKASRQFLNEQVNGRLKSALGEDSTTNEQPRSAIAEATPATAQSEQAEQLDADPTHMTEEERDCYNIIRAITCSEANADRIVPRNGKTYLAVLLDDNNRKPIARLWFKRETKYLGTFDEGKTETRLHVDRPEDIYLHVDRIRSTVSNYLTGSIKTKTPETE